MSDDPRLAAIVAERFGDPADAEAELLAPPLGPAPQPQRPDDTPQQHRQVLLDALRPAARAA
ncbi:hypothetical protein JNW90_19870 [Micromonospora sp. STR1s_5]|nr:hypothetical protein [Micromonospora sp. STR1s_5]